MGNENLPVFTSILLFGTFVCSGYAQQFIGGGMGGMPQQFFMPQQSPSPAMLLAMRYQRPQQMGAGPSGLPSNMMMGPGGYPSSMSGYGGPYSGYPSTYNGYPVRNMPVPIAMPAQDQGYPYGQSQEPMVGGPFGSPSELSPYSAGGYSPMSSFNGMDDGRIITDNGMFPQGPGVRGDLSGVSFFPFARIRPGPGLIIIKQEQDDTIDSMNNTTMLADNSTTSPFDANPSASTETFPLLPVDTTTLAPKAATNSTQTPCTHPIYMNRVFMSTALSMGLISANTSCVVLLDQ